MSGEMRNQSIGFLNGGRGVSRIVRIVLNFHLMYKLHQNFSAIYIKKLIWRFLNKIKICMACCCLYTNIGFQYKRNRWVVIFVPVTAVFM
jgi:hypothetical protein